MQLRFDELGWYQFEILVQTLLKAELGGGVEAWGDYGDFGRDCYCWASLRFPNKDWNPGPFIFQIKFVAGANAAGADYFPALLRAVRAEIRQIRRRCQTGSWQHPNRYVLVTNCPISGEERQRIEALVAKALPQSGLHVMGSRDVAGLAADHPNVRKSFPQILGLADLEYLIREATHKELVERSRAALDQARDLVPVFVPTSCYNMAWRVLEDHAFAVLEGPPEMGKTAIAGMIGTELALRGWEVYECRSPDEILQVYDSNRCQLYLADDAFGRTEYDPTLGYRWERDLGKLLRLVDSRHWLIWTSRKHILERALRSLDLQVSARKFPSAAAVLVDAGELTVAEKTAILFRHARHANLEEALRKLVQDQGSQIVRHPHFTPERIRRLIVGLPEIVRQLPQKAVNSDLIRRAVDHEIANPTDRMRKSFRALSTSHKALLFALVEHDSSFYMRGDTHSLQKSFQRLVEGEPAGSSVTDVLADLSSSFVRPDLQWMHPSMRDLVIDELCSSSSTRRRFLRQGSIGVVKLALSEWGGSTGTRVRPLLHDEGDWSELRLTCESLVQGGPISLNDLVKTVSWVDRETLGAAQHQYELLVKCVYDAVQRHWTETPTARHLDLFRELAQISMLIRPLPPLPDPQSLWDSALAEVRAPTFGWSDPHGIWPLFRWLCLIRVLNEFEPRFLIQAKFPSQYRSPLDPPLQRLAEAIAPAAASGRISDDTAFVALLALEEGRRIPDVADLCKRLHKKHSGKLKEIEKEAEARESLNEDLHDGPWRSRSEPEHFTDSMIAAVLEDI